MLRRVGPVYDVTRDKSNREPRNRDQGVLPPSVTEYVDHNKDIAFHGGGGPQKGVANSEFTKTGVLNVNFKGIAKQEFTKTGEKSLKFKGSANQEFKINGERHRNCSANLGQRFVVLHSSLSSQ